MEMKFLPLLFTIFACENSWPEPLNRLSKELRITNPARGVGPANEPHKALPLNERCYGRQNITVSPTLADSTAARGELTRLFSRENCLTVTRLTCNCSKAISPEYSGDKSFGLLKRI